MDSNTLLTIGIVLAISFMYMTITGVINKRKAKTGEDKQRIVEAVKKALPDGESFSVVYANFKKVEAPWGGGKTTTYYYHYAVAFREDTLFVIPLSFADGLVNYQEPMQVYPENIGRFSRRNHKVSIVDETGKDVLTFWVSDSYEAYQTFEPVNLEQKDEAQAFFTFMERFTSKAKA